MIVLNIIVFAVVCMITKYILYMRRLNSYVKNVKTIPPMLPLIGNKICFMGKSLQEFFEILIEFISKNGTPLKMQVGPELFIVLDKPEDMKTILTSPHCLDKPYLYDFFPSQSGILNLRTTNDWKPLRKHMNPMFNLQVLRSFLPTLHKKALVFVDNLSTHIGKPHFDLLEPANLSSLDALCGTVLGIELDSKSTKGIDFMKSLDCMTDGLVKRVERPYAHLDFIYKWTNMYKEHKYHSANMQYFANLVVEQNKKNLANNNNSVDKSELPPISMIIDKYSEEVAREQVKILLVAGHETSGSTIAFAVLMLSIHPNIQEQVYTELRSIYDTQDEETTTEHMQKMNLLERVIKETLRLYPIPYVMGRSPTKNIPLSECVAPKGATILIPINTAHRRRDIWGDDPDQFNPDHFLPENVKKRHPFAYLPFSGGPRNCIGYQSAMFTLKVMLSAILRQYKFTTNLVMADLKIEYKMTLRLENKHMVGIEKRDW